MSTMAQTPGATTPEPTTMSVGRPRYEGANIRTWIGFKHFMYLVEEAVLDWFRSTGNGPQRLYHELGLGLEIVDSSVQLPALLEIDDEVETTVEPIGDGRFKLRMHIVRGRERVLGLRGNVIVRLIPEADAPQRQPCGRLTAIVAGEARAPKLEPVRVRLEDASVHETLRAAAPGAFQWDWRARYFHYHYSDRVQHSAYVRAVEEVVDRFLADRGISIRRMLVERGWIPVVSRARVQLVSAAHMDEIVHTTFIVREILADRAYAATVDFHVRRGDELVLVAQASILHGYAASRGENAGSLIVLDDEVQAILLGGDDG